MPRAEQPASAEACASLLLRCAEARQTVRVRGGGTKDHLGTLRPTDVTLDTAGLAGILDHVPEDLTVTVGAGIRMDALRDALAAHGQFLPLDPPHLARGATVGGVIAANSAGFARYRYGGVRDLLLGIRVSLPDGSVARAGARVVKNVAGYDLNKLYTGSLGTLGVITEATFKILPIPPATGGTSAIFEKAADAFAAADAVVRTSLRPIALVVERTAERRWRLTVAAAGERAPVDRAIAETARAALSRGGAIEDIADLPATLGQLREIVDRARDGAVIRVALPLSAQTAFADAAAAADRDARLVADAASGTVHVHLRGDEAGVRTTADALLANARVLGGSGRVERAVAGLGTTEGPEPAGAFLMRRLKQAFDPEGVLEPARTVLG
jgi:glycolate oxidase FAD binding subunit